MVNQTKAVPPMNVTPIDLLPKSLKVVREQAKRQFADLLGRMFENADDALFDLADKASSNLDQTMYFDSMREVRIKRESMESKFQQRMGMAFRNLYQPESQEKTDNSSPSEGFSLLEDDELEESVAFRSMTAKIKNRYAEHLDPLTQRINHLVKVKAIDEDNNPLGPHAICDAFRGACSELELEIRATLVVYKLFDKFVLNELEPLYQMANEILRQEGVLPNLKVGKRSDARKSPGRSPAASEAEASAPDSQPQPQGADEDQQELFGMLRDLLAQSRPATTAARVTSGVIPVVDNGPRLAPQDLAQMLSSLQINTSPTGGGAAPVTQSDIHTALASLLRNSAKPQAIGRMDDDVINLITMLFEFILDDHQLPTPMKALLARLQIPMLKVGVLDKTFFSRGGHPARKLLNELATAALGWNESQDLARDPLYKKIEAVVARILNDFDDDVSIFQELLADFTAFTGAENRRAQLIEQRTRNAEEGLGISQHARSVVGYTLNDKAVGKNLPQVVVDILREAMSNYMFLIYVKEGPESETWQEALETVDDLIWSVQVPPGGAERGRLLKLIPSLLQRLRKGFTSLSFNKTRMRGLLQDLERIHLDCLRNKGTESAPSTEAQPARLVPVEARGEPDAAPVQAAAMVASPVIIENLGEPEAVTEAIDAGDIEIAATVDAMASGTWVEFYPDEERKSRAKLAAVIRTTGKYIFVNRVGMKVAEKTRFMLIEEMKAGSLTILDNAQIFDRALENVIGHLREMKH